MTQTPTPFDPLKGASPRSRRRWRRFGLSTLLGWKRLGLFIPYAHADGLMPGDYPALRPWFETAEPQFQALLRRMEADSPALQAIGPDLPPEPRWNQDWFPGLDAAAGYCLVKGAKPRRLVEIGSGHSTRFYARAIRDGGFDCALHAIDPAPRADIATLKGLTLQRVILQHADRSIFETLEPGDIATMDSSHLMAAGSDVDLFLNDILPRLKAGVVVHIHDMFLPDAYPDSWTWRGYAEQQAVAPLIHGGGYQVLWSSHYVRSRSEPEAIAKALAPISLVEGAMETSLWLVKGGLASAPSAVREIFEP
ncbi:MAG: class I SAM-dependent methyltransferase [Magnetovibrionaceae bacterium]